MSKDVAAAKKRRAQRLLKKAVLSQNAELEIVAQRLLADANKTYHAR
ncbi:hypothetical protein [uncultured Photobacterium sp.]|nr:hypothetical protein [uncultured Photobacterium sp.]